MGLFDRRGVSVGVLLIGVNVEGGSCRWTLDPSGGPRLWFLVHIGARDLPPEGWRADGPFVRRVFDDSISEVTKHVPSIRPLEPIAHDEYKDDGVVQFTWTGKVEYLGSEWDAVKALVARSEIWVPKEKQ